MKQTKTPAAAKAEERRNAALAKAQHKELSKLGGLRLNLIPDADKKLDWLFAGVSANECDGALVEALALYLVRYPENRKSFLTKHHEFRDSFVTKLLGE